MRDHAKIHTRNSLRVKSGKTRSIRAQKLSIGESAEHLILGALSIWKIVTIAHGMCQEQAKAEQPARRIYTLFAASGKREGNCSAFFPASLPCRCKCTISPTKFNNFQHHLQHQQQVSSIICLFQLIDSNALFFMRS